MAVKKVVISTIDTRKFVQYLLYLGSLGGNLTKKCTAIKGLFLRAEVEVPADAIIKQTPEMKVAAGPEYEIKEELLEDVQEKTEVKSSEEDKTKQRGRKVKDAEK
jgi:hypothetical protein